MILVVIYSSGAIWSTEKARWWRPWLKRK